MEHIVLDTNVILMSISPQSHFRKIWNDFLNGVYVLCISNEIIEEYSEIIAKNISPVVSDYIINTILTRDNIKFVDPHFRCQLIDADPWIVLLLAMHALLLVKTTILMFYLQYLFLKLMF